AWLAIRRGGVFTRSAQGGGDGAETGAGLRQPLAGINPAPQGGGDGAGGGAGWRQPLAGMNPGPQGGGPVGPALRRPAEVGTAHEAPADTLEHIARVLLRRYGVVFWRLLE